ncbi:MAG: hypothetical protein MPK05_07750 [Gammaproteobacteria bacterium]|nr:hypothetical protein [Gammaproteobacteria bacterium]
MLPAIQSMWASKSLAQSEKLCIRSFLHHGHAFHLYVYDDVRGVPDGAEVKDANEILPESEMFRMKDGRIAPFTDWFRYALLAEKGNFWADLDMVCIKPFDFSEEIVFGNNYGTARINLFHISVLKFPKGHECMRALEKSCRNYGEEMPWDDAADKKRKQKIRRRGADKTAVDYFDFGGPVFTKAVRHFGLEKYAKPFMCFYPCDNFSSYVHVFDRSFAKGIHLYPDTHGMHISNGSIAHFSELDKNGVFDEDSLFEQLKAKYGVAPEPNAPKYDHAAVHAAFAQGPRRLEEREKLGQKRKQKKRAVQALLVCAASFLAGYFLA